MENVFFTEKDESILNTQTNENVEEILKSSHEEEDESPLFLDFPSPFLDDSSIFTIPTSTKPLNTTQPSPSKRKFSSKKGKHSKIHTAQGLRDRRMRLSLRIAREFFDLQDLLGFDKASKTIEWLFCKSNKAIEEVTQSFNQSMATHEIESTIDQLTDATNKEEKIKKTKSRKRAPPTSLARETRDKARVRARERTRARMVIKYQMFGGNPSDDFEKLGLGFQESPKNHNFEKLGLGFQESPKNHNFHKLGYSLLSPFEQHFANNSESSENHFGTTINSSTNFSTFNDQKNYAHNKFFGFCEEWDAEDFTIESKDYGIVPSIAQFTGNNHGKNSC